MKQYRVWNVVLFLLVMLFSQTVLYTACPRCMRKSLALRTLCNLPTANFLWPLVLLLHGILFLLSYTRGHSRAIIRILRSAN